MRFAIPTVAALVLAATASAQQPDPLPLVPPTTVAPVVVSPPPVVVTRPPVVVVAPPVVPPVVIARPGLTIGIGAPYPIYRPYYAPHHYYHHRHW